MEKNKILFIPHNAYHTYNMHLVMEELQSMGADCAMLNIDKVHNEGVEKQAKKLGINTIKYTPFFLLKYRPSAIVTMNDWGGVTKKNVLFANLLGIPTFAIIEGVQDFEDTHIKTHPQFKKRYPYLRSKFPLLTGEYDRKFIKSKNANIIGIARIEKLIGKESKFPTKDHVVINANFSYGKYSIYAEDWIKAVVEACNELGLTYSIAQHIADRTNLSGYNVSKEHINDQVAKGSLLVSRFSTSMLESMALKKPVVYFNTFNERIDKFINSDNCFETATNKEELKSAISQTLANKELYIEKSQKFLNNHVSIDPNKSSARRTAEIIYVNRAHIDISWSERFKIIREEFQRRYIHTH